MAYNMDCMEAMRKMPDKCFDLAVCDPPYFSGPERRGYYGSRVSKIGVHRDYRISPRWEIPRSEYFRELDTHLGSGSSRIAAHDAGLDFVGFEIDPDYFAAQEERYTTYAAQISIFEEK